MITCILSSNSSDKYIFCESVNSKCGVYATVALKGHLQDYSIGFCFSKP